MVLQGLCYSYTGTCGFSLKIKKISNLLPLCPRSNFTARPHAMVQIVHTNTWHCLCWFVKTKKSTPAFPCTLLGVHIEPPPHSDYRKRYNLEGHALRHCRVQKAPGNIIAAIRHHSLLGVKMKAFVDKPG